MAKQRKRERPRVGDVVAIPLPGSRFAYGRVFKDAAIGILDLVSSEIREASEVICRPTAFWTACFDTAMVIGEWPLIGHFEFDSEEEAWAPPSYVRDVLDQRKYRVYHKGKMRAATEEEVAHLEQAVMRKPDEVIEQIMMRLLKGGANGSE